MNESHTIAIQSEFDVFMARMQVRKLARSTGFDITSQARIALATSSLARALRLGETHQGQVSVDCLTEGQRLGIRVICVAVDGVNSDVASRTLTDTKWLVDELIIEELPSNDLKVTVVKWVARGGNHA